MRSIALSALLAVAGCTTSPANNPNAPSAGKLEGEGSTVPAPVNTPADSNTPRPTPGQTPTNDPAKP